METRVSIDKGHGMKKENVLVAALIVIAFGSVYLFNSSKHTQTASSAGPAQAIAGPVDTANAPAGISWKDYTPGLAQARADNKSVFLYFQAAWCSYCVKLKKTTFKDKAVLAYLDENFVSIEVDTDKNPKLATEWNVKGLPTMWFLESDGKKINHLPGYVEPKQMLQILKYIHTKSYDKMSFQEFIQQG